MTKIFHRLLIVGITVCTLFLGTSSHAAYWAPDAVRKNSAGQLDNWLHYYRGLEQIDAKWWEQAYKEFDYYFRSGELHRHMYGIAYFGMGLMYQAKGIPELAIDNYKMAIKEDIHPDVKISDKAWLNIGTIHMKKRAYTDAIDAYTKAVAADAQNGQAHYNLGLALAKVGDLEQAAQQSEEAKKLGIKLVGLDEEIAKRKAAGSRSKAGQTQDAGNKKTPGKANPR